MVKAKADLALWACGIYQVVHAYDLGNDVAYLPIHGFQSFCLHAPEMSDHDFFTLSTMRAMSAALSFKASTLTPQRVESMRFNTKALYRMKETNLSGTTLSVSSIWSGAWRFHPPWYGIHVLVWPPPAQQPGGEPTPQETAVGGGGGGEAIGCGEGGGTWQRCTIFLCV